MYSTIGTVFLDIHIDSRFESQTMRFGYVLSKLLKRKMSLEALKKENVSWLGKNVSWLGKKCRLACGKEIAHPPSSTGI
jgi:hypothetical protein